MVTKFEPFVNNLCCYLNVYSAPPPPQQAATFSRGVVTMKCDISTCTAAHISLLVSGSAQTCFDDQVYLFFIVTRCLLADS